MDKKFIEDMKNLLLAQRQYLLKLNMDARVEKNEIDIDGDETDEIQGNLILEMHNQLNSRNNEKLNKIDAALDRIKDGTYGICEDCEEDIPQKRLETNPYITICVCCAEDREAEAKQRKRY